MGVFLGQTPIAFEALVTVFPFDESFAVTIAVDLVAAVVKRSVRATIAC